MINDNTLETAANVAYLVGIIALIQSSSEAVFQVGRVLVILGILAMLCSLLMRRVHWQPIVERLAILGMLTAIIAMFQPWDIRTYELGFIILGISTLGFIVISHVPVTVND